MHQLVTTGPGRMELRAVADPVPRPDEAMLQVEAVGICGSDLHLLAGDHPYARFPNVQGHELSGRILSLPGGYAGPLRVGQRVAVEPLLTCGRCRPCLRGRSNACVRMRTYGVHVDGGLAERLAVKVGSLHDAGDLEPGLGALVETMSIALQALRRGEVTQGDRVVILGAGPVGLAVTVAATARGARALVVDRIAERLALARGLGADAVAVAGEAASDEAIAAWTHGEGPDVVIEATGSPIALEAAIGMVGPTGVVVVVGLSRAAASIPMVELTRKELTIVGSRNSAGLFPDAVAMVRRERERMARLISHRAPFARATEAFELARDRPAETAKVIVDMEPVAGPMVGSGAG